MPKRTKLKTVEELKEIIHAEQADGRTVDGSPNQQERVEDRLRGPLSPNTEAQAR